jgi:uroporphyrinogen III methyltransferase/synthase
VISRGTLPGQRSVTGTLADIADRAAGLEAPAVTVVGPVAALDLTWLERRPLHGEVVAVTRARAQASELAARLTALGAEVVEAPAIRIERRDPEEDPTDWLGHIAEYRLICFTSPNGVRALFEVLDDYGQDARQLAFAAVAAIGPGTAAELRRWGIRAVVVPERSVAEALVEALDESVEVEGRRVLVARAAEARDVLPDALRARGAHVDVASLYDTVAEGLSDGTKGALGRATYVTFTSSSTVRFFAEAGGLDALGPRARVLSIGPVTSAEARERGVPVDVEAERHDIDGLVEALVADAAARK